MARQQELQAQVASEVRRVLASLGIQMPAPTIENPQERPGYIAHGSPAHAVLLGLVEVGEDDDSGPVVTYTSPKSNTTWRLEDEMAVLSYYPGVDPEKAIALVLRQRVNELDAGVPEAPPNSPVSFAGFARGAEQLSI